MIHAEEALWIDGVWLWINGGCRLMWGINWGGLWRVGQCSRGERRDSSCDLNPHNGRRLASPDHLHTSLMSFTEHYYDLAPSVSHSQPSGLQNLHKPQIFRQWINWSQVGFEVRSRLIICVYIGKYQNWILCWENMSVISVFVFVFVFVR